MPIRPATIADVPQIAAIAHAAYNIYVARIGKPPAPMIADFATHVINQEIFVDDAIDGPAGFIVLFPMGGRLFIENVAVPPERQGQGIGRKLLAFADAEARRHEFDRLFLYTNIHMTENLDFYPKLGYLETHRIHEDGFDRVYFEKRLTT